jgi:hypothetical protein
MPLTYPPQNPWFAMLVMASNTLTCPQGWAPIPFDTVYADPGGMCATGANANITVPLSGIWMVNGRWQCNNFNSAIRCLMDIGLVPIVASGASSSFRLADLSTNAGSEPGGWGSIVLPLTAGTILYPASYQFVGPTTYSGCTIPPTPGTPMFCWFSVTYQGP